MFGALITLVFGTYLGISAAGKIQSNRKARMEARAQGKKYYMTNKYVYHTVDTDEYCRIERESNSFANHTVCVTNNGRVIEDYTVEKVDEYNKEIKEAGKKYYYVEDTRNSWVPVDKENGKPFRIDIYEDYLGNRHFMVYYLNKDEKGHIKKFDYSPMEYKELKTVDEINLYTLPGRNLSEQDINRRTCSRLYQRTKSLIQWNFPIERGF